MNNLLRCIAAVIALGVVSALVVPTADAARTASLAESRLILDKNDVFLYPQVAVEHSRMVGFDYGPVAEFGSGVAIFGDESTAFGIAVYRGDLIEGHLRDTRRYFHHAPGERSLGGPANPIGDGIAQEFDLPGFLDLEGLTGPTPHVMADAFGAVDIGNGSVGARLSAGSAGMRQVNVDGEEESMTHTFGSVVLGYSMVDDLRLDTSLTLRFSGGSGIDEAQDDADMVTQQEGNSVMAGVSARGYAPIDDNWEVGFLADVAFSNETGTLLPDADDATDALRRQFSILGGVGPVFRIEDTTIAAYGVAGHYRQLLDVASDGDQLLSAYTRNTVIPGTHVAADVGVVDWLYLRTGLQYNYGLETAGEWIDDAERDDQFMSQRTSNFGWRAGLGLEVEQFTFDAAFQSGLITGGPNFVGGTTEGTFAMASVGYRF